MKPLSAQAEWHLTVLDGKTDGSGATQLELMPQAESGTTRGGLPRATLAAAVVVVDATRGVSTEDRRWLDVLSSAPTVVALSKCDLLQGPGAVARCARLVEADAQCDVVAPCGTSTV